MTAHFRSTSEMDAAFRFVVHAHSHASLNGPTHEHSSTAVAAATAAEFAHTVHEVAELAIEAVHEASAGAAAADMVAAGAGAAAADMVAAGAAASVAGAVSSVGSMVLPPLLALGAGLAEIDHAWAEHYRRGEEVDREQMRGALLYCLGRVPHPGRPGVAERIGTHARDGAVDAERFARLRPQAFQQLRERVMTHYREGEQAVLLGRDRGPEFERRYTEDPIFRMGADEARAARQADAAAFRERAESLRTMTAQLEDARRGTTRA